MKERGRYPSREEIEQFEFDCAKQGADPEEIRWLKFKFIKHKRGASDWNEHSDSHQLHEGKTTKNQT